MKTSLPRTAAAFGALLLLAPWTAPLRAETTPHAPGVKDYLLGHLAAMKVAATDMVAAADAYARLASEHGGIAAAYAADPEGVNALVERMREDYKKMDSYGYERIEGIVAGVGSLAHYDIDLDAGVPASEGPEDVANVVLELSDGSRIDREGSLFTYILEPALWGGNPRWCVETDGRLLPRPEVMTAAAAATDRLIDALQKDAGAWDASVEDCFGAMLLMTPTLSEYFEDWKESRYEQQTSGRFQAVSRLSDMRGIMGSCAVMYEAVAPRVAEKDPALARSVTSGFAQILSFLDLLERREKEGAIHAAEIEELAAQAREKTDKLVPQIEQSAALLGLPVDA